MFLQGKKKEDSVLSWILLWLWFFKRGYGETKERNRNYRQLVKAAVMGGVYLGFGSVRVFF